MRKLVLALLITIPAAWLTPAEAQLFGRKPKTPAAQRVPELLYQAKADPDERKRAAAANELGSFDAKAHPEIVGMLTDIARTDPKAGVRHEALQSLGQLRPISPIAGQTLEWSATNDDTWKNRLQAKSSLMRYQLAGYFGGKADPKADPKTASPPPMTVEPPVIDPRSAKSAKPAINAGNVSRSAPSKFAPPIKPAPKPNPPSTPPPVIVTQPAPPPNIIAEPSAVPKIVIEPMPVPNIIIDAPSSIVVPSPAVPKLTIEPAPRLTPSIPSIPLVTEPNFRPAGQAPPRAVPTPSVPRVPAPTPSKDDSGPSLTPPM